MFFFVAFFSMIFHLKKRELQINLPYIIYLIATVIFIVMSGMSYGHYRMILIPAVVYPLSLVFSDIEKIKDRQTSKTIEVLVALYTLTVIIAPNWIGIIEGIPKKYDGREKTHKSEVVEKVTDIIAEKTHEEQKLSVYGNWDIIYVVSNRLHATRYSYQFPIGEVEPDILNEYFAALEKEQPTAVVVQAGKYDDRIKCFLGQYEYQLAYASDVNNVGKGAQVYIK